MAASGVASGVNAGVPDIPYFTPKHLTDPGVPFDASKRIPTLFTPLTIRSKTLRNRIIVAPMCQYSTAPNGPEIGKLTDYHIATLGHYALKGASLVFIEATGVQPNGRISPNCPGIWSDDQIEGVKRVSDFIRSQGALSGIQLAHAGRKSSTVPPWVAGKLGKPASARATKEAGGWPEDVVGPMGGLTETWDRKGEEGGFYPPRQLTVEEIQDLVKAFADGARRAIAAGIDVIEIHAAHGYLIHQFLSPVTNRRNDQYGGSFENRTRLLTEVIQAVRKAIPDTTPLFLRVSSTEWLDNTDVAKKYGGCWNVESTLRLARLLPALGVDLLDVSSGGNDPQQKVNMFASKDYQIKIANQIRQEIRSANLTLLIGAVGLITEAEQARDIVEDSAVSQDATLAEEAATAKEMTERKPGKEPLADVILVARQFMREPEWVLRVAWKLGVDVAWPNQFLRVRFPKL